MPEQIVNPVINRFLNEVGRPLSEAARGLYLNGQANAERTAAMIVELAGRADDDVVNDGRLGEGVPPPTVGQCRAAAAMLSDTLEFMARHPGLAAVVGLCARPVEIR